MPKQKLKMLHWNIMKIDGDILKTFNVYYQYLCSQKMLKILDKLSKIERSKNEMEKQINKL